MSATTCPTGLPSSAFLVYMYMAPLETSPAKCICLGKRPPVREGNLRELCTRIQLMASTGSPDFFQASLFQLLKLEIHCEDHISPSCISAVHI